MDDTSKLCQSINFVILGGKKFWKYSWQNDLYKYSGTYKEVGYNKTLL